VARAYLEAQVVQNELRTAPGETEAGASTRPAHS